MTYISQKKREDKNLDQYYSIYTKLSDGLPRRVKSSFLEAKEGDDIKNNMGDRYFDNIDKNYRSDLMTIRNYIRNAYFSIIALNSVLSDVEMCARMINRYPWHGTNISKGDHFEFVWSGFSNHCYIFEERTKQLGKHLNQLPSFFGGDQINVGRWVKQVKKALSEHIAFRGSHVHEWSRNYEGYEFFNAVDFLSSFDEKYQWAQKQLYPETKRNLRNEILESREKMLTILLCLEPDPVAYVLNCCEKYETLLEKYEIS